MRVPSRRQFLTTLGGTAAVIASGCTGQRDGQQTETPTGSRDGSDGVVNGDDRQPTVYGSHKDRIHPHPDFDGVTTGQWLSAGRITRPHRPVVTWIQSAEERTALIGFDSRRVRSYVRETAFDQYGVLVVRTNIQNTCDAVNVAGWTVEDDRLAVETVQERIEPEQGACEERGDDATYPAWSVGIAVRLPVEADRPLAVVERDGTTWSNRYRVALEAVSDDIVFEEAGLSVDGTAFTDELAPVARDALLTAIEAGRYETATVPQPLARALASHEYVHDGTTLYELDATVLRYRVTREAVDEADVPAEAEVVRPEAVESEAAETLLHDVAGNRRIETVYLPSEFQQLTGEADYVQLRDHYFDLSVERIDPGPPYVLRAERGVTPHEVVDSVSYVAAGDEHWVSVSDSSEFESQKRAELDAAMDGDYVTHNLPALFRDHTDLVGIEGRTYRIRIVDAVGTAEPRFDTAPEPP